MVTAYPSVSDSFSLRVETGKDLQPLATQTQTYQRGSDKLKTAILFQTDQKNHVPVHYCSTYSGKEFLHIDIKLKATKNIYRIFIEKDRSQIVKQSHGQSGAKWMESKYAKVYRKATQRTKGYCVDLENSVVQKIFKEDMPKMIQSAVVKVTTKLRSFDQRGRPERFQQESTIFHEGR